MRLGITRVVTPRHGLLVAVAVAVGELIGIAGRWSQYLGVWSETQAAAGRGLLIALPAAAGVTAWIGAANRRHGLDAMAALASRPALRVQAREFVETWAWALAGLLLVTAVAWTATAQQASFGRPHLAPLLVDMTTIGTATALGLAAGRRLPWLLAAPLTAIATYGVISVLMFTAQGTIEATTPIDWRWATYSWIPLWIFGAQSLVWALVAAAVVLRRGGRRRTSILALWLAGLAAAPLLYVGTADQHVDAHAAGLRCTPGPQDSVVCLPRAKAYLAPEMVSLLGETEPLLTGLAPERQAVIDNEVQGLSAAVDADLDRVAKRQAEEGRTVMLLATFNDLSAYTQLDRDGFLSNLSVAAFPVDTTMHEDAIVTNARPSDVLQRWFLQRLDVPLDGSAGPGAPVLDGSLLSFANAEKYAQWFDDLTDAERAQWFRAHRDKIMHGGLRWADFA